MASEIVKQQDAFFRLGVGTSQATYLERYAEAIEMRKYRQPGDDKQVHVNAKGLYEAEVFFTSAIQSATGGDAHSAEAVRFRIKALIDGESPKFVLSDDKIVDILKQDGIDIARRTVAKYRESMRIGSSVERRRMKAGTL